MSKNRSLKTGPTCDKKFVWLDNPGQNTWNKIEKSRKIGQVKKNIYFCGFFDLLSKFNLFLQGD